MIYQKLNPLMVNYINYFIEKFIQFFILGQNSSIPSMTVIDKNGLHIIFQFEKQDQILLIHLQATNSTQIPITNFVFKAAVPKVNKSIYIYK